MPNHKSLLATAILLLSLAGLAAWSITDSYFGNRFGTQDARAYAMGGTGLFDDLRPFAIGVNPANLTLPNHRLGLAGNLFVNRNEDNRAVPLYNSFDNYIDDAVYASNIHYTNAFAAAGYYAHRLDQFKVGIGAYHRPLLSFEGNYEEQIRNNRNTDNDGYPEMIAVNRIENDGLLGQTGIVLGLGWNPRDFMDLNLGLEFDLLSGRTTSEKSIRWSQWAIDTAGAGVLPDYLATEETDLDGSRFKAGAALRISRKFGLAATFSTKATLERGGSYSLMQPAYLGHAAVDTTTTFNEDYILPAELRIGLNYQPRNIMRTWFNLEAEYVQFSQVDERYDDFVNFYAGVEHHVQNRLPLRLGFQATHGYLRLVESDGSIIAKQILTPMLTAGSSVKLLDNLFLDLGFGYAWREFEALDLFGDAYYNDKLYTGSSSYILWPNQYIALTNRGWENPDKVRGSNLSFSSCLSFTW